MGTSADLPSAPAWRGINHLALVTPDMDATVRFYAGVLGMPLVDHAHGGADAPLLLRDGPRQHRGLLRGRGGGDLRQGRGRAEPRTRSSSTTSRSTCPTSTRSSCCRAPPGRRLRGHRGGRPRRHPLGVLHRPERHRAGGVVLGGRRHRPALDPTDAGCSTTPTRCPRWPSWLRAAWGRCRPPTTSEPRATGPPAGGLPRLGA